MNVCLHLIGGHTGVGPENGFRRIVGFYVKSFRNVENTVQCSNVGNVHSL